MKEIVETGCHLIFFDGSCGLCDKWVEFLLKNDTKKLFNFAPLEGSTAESYLKTLPPEMRFNDSLILIANYKTPFPQVFLLAKGALKSLWLLGGWWMLPGVLSFLPGILFNWIYLLVAKNRHIIFGGSRTPLPLSEYKDRFLP